jgi:hypothetical protein
MNGEPSSMTDRPLQREIETCNVKLPELLGSIGRFARVKGDQVEGICDSYRRREGGI